MALRNTITGEYHKIVYEDTLHELHRDMVLVRIFRDEEHRELVKENRDDENNIRFIKSEAKHIFLLINIVQILLEGIWDIEKDVKDNYLVTMYNYLKTLPEYSNFVDC